MLIRPIRNLIVSLLNASSSPTFADNVNVKFDLLLGAEVRKKERVGRVGLYKGRVVDRKVGFGF